ncbi:37S ribosomal protein S19 [Penicillium daleae]|uniref:37S ribosomal protein S19 n=1 Tax=Penicillium daleae TaxID=63821 RepID=A0AAD6FY97_9EURO|nr:37S ribosomal protein S19 [Penicillium daleae]KAJ5433170.1 37S ribosomal protein S19 [Penicillium daleae]
MLTQPPSAGPSFQLPRSFGKLQKVARHHVSHARPARPLGLERPEYRPVCEIHLEPKHNSLAPSRPPISLGRRNCSTILIVLDIQSPPPADIPPPVNTPPIRTQKRAATILPNFVGLRFAVHNGKTYQEIQITEEMVGRKLGEYVAYVNLVAPVDLRVVSLGPWTWMGVS